MGVESIFIKIINFAYLVVNSTFEEVKVPSFTSNYGFRIRTENMTFKNTAELNIKLQLLREKKKGSQGTCYSGPLNEQYIQCTLITSVLCIKLFQLET